MRFAIYAPRCRFGRTIIGSRYLCKAPIYANGRETAAPLVSHVTIAQINAENTAFWQQPEPNRIQELLAGDSAFQAKLDDTPNATLTMLLQDHCEFKARVAARGGNGGKAKAGTGRLEESRAKARELLKSEPDLKRDEVAERIHQDLHLSVETVIDHLKKDGWWSSVRLD